MENKKTIFRIHRNSLPSSSNSIIFNKQSSLASKLAILFVPALHSTLEQMQDLFQADTGLDMKKKRRLGERERMEKLFLSLWKMNVFHNPLL